jgi:hypothetical protein
MNFFKITALCIFAAGCGKTKKVIVQSSPDSDGRDGTNENLKLSIDVGF